jgi:hypothetical protein
VKSYVLLAGGLGNQLFQYAAAVEIGASEVVFLDLISNERKNSAGLPDIVNLNLPVPFTILSFPDLSRTIQRYYLWLLGSTSQNSGIRFKIANSKLISLITHLITLKITNQETKLLLENRANRKLIAEKITPMLLVGYFQNLEACNQMSRHLLNIFESNKSTSVETFLAPIRGKHLMGVHIRKGDYVGHATFGLLSDLYFKLQIQENISEEKTIIFFSDSQLDFSIYLSEEYLGQSTVCPADFSAAEVLLLMSACNSLILSNSSLSWWAGFLVKSMGGKVVAPKPWFSKEIQSANFYPTEWTCAPSEFSY